MRLTRPRIVLPPALGTPGAWALLLTTASVEFARGALFIALLPNFLSERRHFSPVAVGLVISSQYLADIVIKTVGGALADRRGPWPILLPALTASALAAAALPHARTLGGLMLLAAAFGVGAAANWPAAVAGVTRLGGEGGEATALSLVFIAWLGGGGLGPVLTSFLSGRGYAHVFHLVTAVVLLAPAGALVALLLRFGPGPAIPDGMRDDARGHIALIWHHLKEVRLILPPLFLQAMALGMMLPVAAPFVHDVVGLPRSAFGLLLLVGGAGCVLALPFSGSLVDRFGYRWFLTGGLAAAGGATYWLSTARNTTDMLVRAVFLGLSYAAILPSWNKLLVDAVPESLRGTFMGLFMGVEGLGVVAGPTLGGLLWARIGPQAAFAGAAVVVVTMAFYYIVVPPARLKGRT